MQIFMNDAEMVFVVTGIILESSEIIPEYAFSAAVQRDQPGPGQNGGLLLFRNPPKILN